MQTHDLLTPPEVADIFRVSPSTVARWTRLGTLTGIKIGGSLRYRREDVERLLADPVGSGEGSA